ncbi:MAG TPA: WXG100 family type VII secretion target [Frankiaceae bacterium]|nr:WXG100 family type VII secretion target [Frankiaceae bacterium]
MLAGTAYSVDPTQLHSTSVALGGEAASLEEVLQRTQRSVDALRGFWQGASHTHYETLYAEWQRGAQAVRHALGAIAGMTAKASEIYRQGDQGVSTLISRL